MTVTKVPDAKRQITLNADKLEILGQSSGTISMKWFPIEAGCWRDVLQFTDNKRIKYDITIVTTAKVNKGKTQKRPSKKAISSKLSVSSAPTINKRLYQDNTLLRVPSNVKQPLFANVNKQTRGDEPKRESSLNKENILNKYQNVKIHTLREDNRNARPHHGYREPSILSEQHSNVWSDGSVLSQSFFASSAPQEIRRATYLKEKRHCNNVTTIYERSEEVIENVACAGDRCESNFSMLINELKFTATGVVTISPRPVKKESTESTNSLNVEAARDERNKTFAVGHRTFEASAISIPEIVLSPVTRPLDYCESSFKDGVNNLIASSPILQRSLNAPRTDRSGCFVDSVDCSRRIDCDYFSCTTVPRRDIEIAKKADDVYIEISPPRKYHSKPYAPLFNTKIGKITKEKNPCNSRGAKGLQLFIPVTSEL